MFSGSGCRNGEKSAEVQIRLLDRFANRLDSPQADTWLLDLLRSVYK